MFYLRKRPGCGITINRAPLYTHSTPKGADLISTRGRPPLLFYLIKLTKINLPLFGRTKWINRLIFNLNATA